ncbi:MAG: ABC transporter permease subunit, partial [Arenimonas sp.]
MTSHSRLRLTRAVLLERLPGYVWQLVLLAGVVWLLWRGVSNFLVNAHAHGVSMGYGFLRGEAGFAIAQTMVPFGPASSYWDAVVVATLNTLLVVALASVLGTVIALPVAFGRLSAHPLIRGVLTAYVELFRNIPLLLQIFFWYFSAIALLPGVSDSLELGAVLLNNRGLFLPRLLMTGIGAWSVAVVVVVFIVLFMVMRRMLQSRAPVGAGALALGAIVLLALCLLPLVLMQGQFALERPAAEGFNVSGGVALLRELIALTLGLSIYNS